MAADQTRSQLFRQAGNHPLAWWRVGENLLISASLLRKSCMVSMPMDTDVPDARALTDLRRSEAVFGTSLMLRGFAIEAMLKALFLDKGGRLSDDHRFLTPTRHSHDLRALAEAVALELSPTEAQLLAVLEYWIEEGRYPIQKNVSRYDRVGPEGKPLRYTWDDYDEGVWQAFISRLIPEGKTREARWKAWEK